MKPEDEYEFSIRSIMTDNLATEYNRLQKQLNFHREVAGVELTQFDQGRVILHGQQWTVHIGE